MAKKLSPAERAQWQKDLSVLRAACQQCEQVLADDDAAQKTIDAESYDVAVKTIADGGSGDAREALRRGVLAVREHPRSIVDQVHGSGRKE